MYEDQIIVYDIAQLINRNPFLIGKTNKMPRKPAYHRLTNKTMAFKQLKAMFKSGSLKRTDKAKNAYRKDTVFQRYDSKEFSSRYILYFKIYVQGSCMYITLKIIVQIFHSLGTDSVQIKPFSTAHNTENLKR